MNKNIKSKITTFVRDMTDIGDHVSDYLRADGSMLADADEEIVDEVNEAIFDTLSMFYISDVEHQEEALMELAGIAYDFINTGCVLDPDMESRLIDVLTHTEDKTADRSRMLERLRSYVDVSERVLGVEIRGKERDAFIAILESVYTEGKESVDSSYY